MECVEEDAAVVEEEYYLADAAVVIHEQDKLNQEREGKKKIKPKSCWVHQWIKERHLYGCFENFDGLS